MLVDSMITQGVPGSGVFGPKGACCAARMPCPFGGPLVIAKENVLPERKPVRIGEGEPQPPPMSTTHSGKTGGGGVSVMICTQLAWLQPSFAVHVRVMVSAISGHGPPLSTSLNVTVGEGLQLSVAVAVPVVAGVVGVPHGPVKSGGHVITGGVMSLIVKTWVHVLELPQVSRAW
jgi:hypothetical protein